MTRVERASPKASPSSGTEVPYRLPHFVTFDKTRCGSNILLMPQCWLTHYSSGVGTKEECRPPGDMVAAGGCHAWVERGWRRDSHGAVRIETAGDNYPIHGGTAGGGHGEASMAVLE